MKVWGFQDEKNMRKESYKKERQKKWLMHLLNLELQKILPKKSII